MRFGVTCKALTTSIRRLAPLLGLPIALAACAPRPFVYRPHASAGVPKTPHKVAVLPFADATPDYEVEGGRLRGSFANITKGGFRKFEFTIPHVSPELWAKAFADELAASGAFESARYLVSESDIQGETLLVRGTIRRSDYQLQGWADTLFVVEFAAERLADRTRVWQHRTTVRGNSTPRKPLDDIQEYVREVLLDGRDSLIARLQRDEPAPARPEPPAKQESAEEILKRAGSGG